MCWPNDQQGLKFNLKFEHCCLTNGLKGVVKVLSLHLSHLQNILYFLGHEFLEVS